MTGNPRFFPTARNTTFIVQCRQAHAAEDVLREDMPFGPYFSDTQAKRAANYMRLADARTS